MRKKQRPEYTSWRGMRSRCNNPKNKGFPLYGGRGIKICERWNNSFDNFLADVGERPSPKHSIDRIDNNGNYEPSNVRWATPLEQSRNRRCVVKVITNDQEFLRIESETYTGLPPSTIKNRLQRGWELERAISAPKYPAKTKKTKPIIPVVKYPTIKINLLRFTKLKRKNQPPVLIGEKNPQSKLTNEQVKLIQDATGSKKIIANKFNISLSQVYRIKNGRRSESKEMRAKWNNKNKQSLF